MNKQIIEDRKQIILSLLKGFCDKMLNEEYYTLSEKLIQKLGRKRNVPYITGKPEIWAAAVIHALGSINFLFDRSFEPYVTLDDINLHFGTIKSTTGNKSKLIRDLLKLSYWDKEFSTARAQKSNPYADMVVLNGMLVPLKALPEEYQQMVLRIRNIK